MLIKRYFVTKTHVKKSAFKDPKEILTKLIKLNKISKSNICLVNFIFSLMFKFLSITNSNNYNI